jgi:hypothetical protein
VLSRSDTPPPEPQVSPRRDIVRWRLRLLVDSGFPPEEAREVAGDPGVDVHAVLELMDRGCPPQLAVRIVAPLEHPAPNPASR